MHYHLLHNQTMNEQMIEYYRGADGCDGNKAGIGGLAGWGLKPVAPREEESSGPIGRENGRSIRAVG
jgi:hypothetical protein